MDRTVVDVSVFYPASAVLPPKCPPLRLGADREYYGYVCWEHFT